MWLFHASALAVVRYNTWQLIHGALQRAGTCRDRSKHKASLVVEEALAIHSHLGRRLYDELSCTSWCRGRGACLSHILPPLAYLPLSCNPRWES